MVESRDVRPHLLGREAASHGVGSARRAAVLLLLAGVLAAGAWYDAVTLTRQPLPVGLDGYYYVQQVNTLRETGHFYYPTNTPVVLYALTGTGLLLGDTAYAIKVATVLMHALLCLGVFALLVRVGCPAWLGVLGGAMCAAAGGHRYMTIEFVNNLGAVMLLVWAGWCLLKATEPGRFAWKIAAVILLTLSIFSHKSALGVAIVVAALVYISRRLSSLSSTGKYVWTALIVVGVAWVVPAVLAAQGVVSLPSRLEPELLARPRLPFIGVGAVEKSILMLVAPAMLFLLARLPRQRRESLAGHLFCALALLSLALNLNPFLSHHTAFINAIGRLDALSYVQTAILVPGLIWLCLSERRWAVWLVVAAVAPLVVLSALTRPPFGIDPSFIETRARLVRSLTDNREQLLPQLGASPLIVSAHGHQFILSSVLGVPAQRRLPEEAWRGDVYWLLLTEARMSLPTLATLAEDAGGRPLVLAESGKLRQHLENANEDERRKLFELNLHLREACVKKDFGRRQGACVFQREAR